MFRTLFARCKSLTADNLNGSNILFATLSVVTFVILSAMTYFEVKARGCNKSNIRLLILGSLLVFQVLMFINFAFLTNTARILGITVVQGMTAAIISLTAYYYMRKSSKVLKNKKRWN